MSSISSLNQNLPVCYCYGSKLSKITIQKLESLGIDPTQITSESQAQIIIAQVEAAKSNTGQYNGGKQQLLLEAKSLAQEVGTSISSQDSLENILSKISDDLNSMGKEPTKKELATKYQAKLKDLAQRANISINIEEKVFNTMNMISVSNRIIFGL